MATQIVMDQSGDRRHSFNPNDTRELARAERRFKDLTSSGYTAAVRTASGESRRISAFDPMAEDTLFFPRLVGG
jgi:hypothetical protein